MLFYQHLRHAKPLVCQRAQWDLFVFPSSGLTDVHAKRKNINLTMHSPFAHFSVRFINLIMPRFPRPNELRLAVVVVSVFVVGRWSSMPTAHFHGTARMRNRRKTNEKKREKNDFHIIRSFYGTTYCTIRCVAFACPMKLYKKSRPFELVCGGDGGWRFSHAIAAQSSTQHPRHTFVHLLNRNEMTCFGVAAAAFSTSFT